MKINLNMVFINTLGLKYFLFTAVICRKFLIHCQTYVLVFFFRKKGLKGKTPLRAILNFKLVVIMLRYVLKPLNLPWGVVEQRMHYFRKT